MMRKTKSRPPLAYEAVSNTARLDPLLKNSFNFSRDLSDLYANTSISGLKRRSRSQPADQQSMLMGDINTIGPRPASAVQSNNFAEKVGGPRAAVALTNRAQIASGLYDNQIGIAAASTTTSILTQAGTTTVINVAATTWKMGDLVVKYNSGSVDPGAFGSYVVFVDDPQFLGGAVIYKASLVPSDTRAALGRLGFGTILTVGGGGGSGGGGGGGTCVLDGTIIVPLGDEPWIEERYEEDRWHTITTEHFSLTASYNHPVCDSHRGFTSIANISIGDYVVTKMGEERVVNCYTRLMKETKVKVIMAHGHLFWGNGILCHNFKN